MGAGILIGPLSLLLFSLVSISAAAQGGGGSAPPIKLWCVAKNNAEDAALQSALDWACVPGRADCGPIQNDGACYDGSDIQRTASYAFNDYYLKNGPSDENCNFGNTAALTSLDPSHGNCKFRPSVTSGNGNISGVVPGVSADPSSNGLVATSRWDLGLFAIFAIFPLIS
ncbi:hypothetical protein OROHE_012258 [Orobanche hederae]